MITDSPIAQVLLTSRALAEPAAQRHWADVDTWHTTLCGQEWTVDAYHVPRWPSPRAPRTLAEARAIRLAQLALPLCRDCAEVGLVEPGLVARECVLGDGCTRPQDASASLEGGCGLHGMTTAERDEQELLDAAGL